MSADFPMIRICFRIRTRVWIETTNMANKPCNMRSAARGAKTIATGIPTKTNQKPFPKLSRIRCTFVPLLLPLPHEYSSHDEPQQQPESQHAPEDPWRRMLQATREAHAENARYGCQRQEECGHQ